MSAVPIPTVKPVPSSSDDSLFGYVTSFVDTAGELASEYLQFKVLQEQLNGGTPNTTGVESGTAMQNAIPTQSVQSGLTNQQLAIGGIAGLGLVAAIAILT